MKLHRHGTNASPALCTAALQDEAKELLGRPDNWSPERTIEYLLQHCSYAVVTLGAKGCAAGCRADSIVCTGSSASGLLARTVSLTESTLSADGTPLDGALVLRQAAVSGVEVVDTTGAGDAFSSGFLYGKHWMQQNTWTGLNPAGGIVVWSLAAARAHFALWSSLCLAK